MKIFRYYKAEYGMRVLNDLQLRASDPKTLNDPFELSPNIDPSQFTGKKLERLLRLDRNVDYWYQREEGWRKFSSKKQFKRWYLKDIPRRAAELLLQVPNNVEHVKRSFVDLFSRYWRIICASSVFDSILMWSHYAENHAGIVLEFDTAEAPFTNIDKECIAEVIYSEKKANYSHFDKVARFRKEMFAVAATKATDWAYEKEVRVFIPSTPFQASLFVPLTPRCISAVYLGSRSTTKTTTLIRNALSRAELAHVQAFQARLHPSEYALTFERSNPSVAA